MAWNVRGATKRGFATHVKTLVSCHDVKVLAIFEPHVSGPISIRIAKGFGFDSVHLEHAVGFAGGIWIFWNSTQVTVNILHSTKFVVTVLIEHEKKKWISSFVYASPHPITRKNL